MYDLFSLPLFLPPSLPPFCPPPSLSLQAFKHQELPGDITKRITQQEEKIKQQQEELERLRTETKLAQEELHKRQESEQQMFHRQLEELQKMQAKLKEFELKKMEGSGWQVCVCVCLRTIFHLALLFCSLSKCRDIIMCACV